MITGTQNLLACSNAKGEKMHKIEAYILNRKDRKAWYIRYKVFFKNDIVTKEESSKVLKSEKNLKYMQTRYLPAWISEKKQELNVEKQKSTKFKYFLDKFLEEMENFEDYQNIFYRTNRILEEFDDRDILEISKGEVKEFINSLKNLNSGGVVSKNTKKKYLRVFTGAFEKAVDFNILESNFCENIHFFGREKLNEEKIEPFTKKEVKVLLEKSKDSKYGIYLYHYLLIAFFQGMSPSEILGLQIGDVNLKNKTISIKRDITKGKIRQTKTVFRNREIPIFNTVLASFVYLLSFAKQKNSLWLFSKPDGSHLEDVKDIRGSREIIKDTKKIKNKTKWYLLLDDCGIRYRDLKNARHTFAVSAIESKAFTLQQIANMLGHSSLQMIIKHYAKWIKNKALDANREVNLFGDTLGDTNKKDYSEEVYKLS